MWAIANLAADSVSARDELIEAGLISHITEILNTPEVTVSLLRVTCWAASIICRGRPEPPYSKVSHFMSSHRFAYSCRT